MNLPYKTVATVVILLSYPSLAARPEAKLDEPDPSAKQAKKATKKPSVKAPELPWTLDRPFKYSWFTGKAKTGSILVTIKKIDDPKGAFYRLTSHRRQSHDKQGFKSTGELDFNPDLTPIRYKDEAVVTHVRGGGRQDWEISFKGRHVRSTCISNGQADKATTVEADLPEDTYLFGVNALEHWAILGLKVKSEGKTSLKVFYPLFGKSVTIDFTKDAVEEIEIGDKKVKARRYAFVYPEYRDRGSVWLDERGRLLRYKSGPITLQIDGI